MQLLATDAYYFIKSVKTILKCCRTTGRLAVTNHTELALLDDLHMLADVHCFMGTIELDGGVPHLLLVLDCTAIAELEYSDLKINRIDRVCALPLRRDGSTSYEALFPPDDSSTNGTSSGSGYSAFIPSSSAATGASGGPSPAESLARLRRHQKKIVKFVSDKVAPNPKFSDELVRFINESGNFYFCPSANITLSVQRRSQESSEKYDLRYFWNRALLASFFCADGTPDPAFHEWIVPVIYGHVNQRTMRFDGNVDAIFTLVSRRSTRRAGVRYLRRGVDDNGDVANFVETEFIIHVFGHCLTFVQIRGSVPIFWSQKGYRFRPPLCINRPFVESYPAFQRHFNSLIEDYGKPLVIVNLVEQRGRELCLGESYLQHILEMDSPDVSFLSFDFHQNCRAMQFHKVSDITNAIRDDIQRIGFCWLDKNGQLVRRQNGVIRTNCVDCLDRTNVVQCAVSQAVCLIQATKLGLIEPGNDIFENTKLKYTEEMIRLVQAMWADHGDSISKQYAGTNALKGDVTRGGRRKLIGFMRDGYNSASRYYLCHVRDAQRQKIIDAILHGSVSSPTRSAAADVGTISASGDGASSQVDDVDLLLDLNENDVVDEDEDDTPDEDDAEESAKRPNAVSSPANLRSGTVRFDANAAAADGWVLVNELKERIAKSKSHIQIM